MKVILGLGMIISLASFSFFVAYSDSTDFPVFYSAAKTILDPRTPASAVYDTDINRRYPVPEHSGEQNSYIYSLPVAYLFAPLALMPYYAAKTAMIFVNIMLYLAAVALLLRHNGASGGRFVFPLLLSWAWFPFIQGIRGGQVDTIILFLIASAGLYAVKKRVGFSGGLLAVASLFKLFPLAIAAVLALKNWRLPALCALFFGASFIIPGSTNWLGSLGNIYIVDFMPTHLIVNNSSLAWIGLLYAAAITASTAIIVYRFRHIDDLLLIGFAIPTIFLVMPIVEYHHLTLLIFSYVCLLKTSNKHNRPLLIIALLSFIMIDVSLFVSRQSYLLVRPAVFKALIIIGLLLCWCAMAGKIYSFGQTSIFNGPKSGTQ